MDNIVLFTGIYDLFGLRLVKKFFEHGQHSIYCLSDGENWNTLNGMVDSLSQGSEKEELTRCLDNIRVMYVSIEKLDIPSWEELFTHKKISLWHLDKEISFDAIYQTQIFDSNERVMENIRRLCEVFQVSDVNYISSIYLDTADETLEENKAAHRNDKTCGLFGQIREANERFILERLKPLNIKVRIFRTPLVFRQLGGDDRMESVELFISRLLEFKHWVSSRVPEYFKDNALTIFAQRGHTVNTSTAGSIIDEIFDKFTSCRTDSTNIIDILSFCRMPLDMLLREIDRNLGDISIRVTDRYEELNAIDLIFDRITAYHLPYLRRQGRLEPGKEGQDGDRAIGTYVANALQRNSNVASEAVSPGERVEKSILSKNGKKLTYYTAGQGETILIINAYGVIIDAWDSIVKELSKDFRVIVWQVRGIYNSEKANDDPTFVFGVYEQVEDIEEIVENEGLKSFHIISWCSGVKSALLYYHKHRDMVKSQILLAGEYGPYEGSRKHHSKFRENVQLIAQMVRDNEKMLDFYMRIIHNGMFNKPIKQYTSENKSYIYEVMPEKHRDILLDAFTSKEKMVNFLNMCMEYYQHDITEFMGTVQIPVLFISAECDQIAPHEQSEWAHSMVPNSNYTCLPGATHLLILERPEDVMERIRQHMKYYAAGRLCTAQ